MDLEKIEALFSIVQFMRTPRHTTHETFLPSFLFRAFPFQAFQAFLKMTVIVLDNDETTGYYSHLLTYLSFVARCRTLTAAEETDIIATITEVAKTHGVFRPGTEEFLKAIAERKRLGIVSSVVMYTNALANPDMSWYTTSGVVDWPHFIARILSCLAGDAALFDVVLSRPPHLAHIPYPKKNFARVTDALAAAGRAIGEDERIFFFDDKPGEILGASERFVAWGVAEYKVPLSIAQIDAALERVMPADGVYRWAEYTPAVIHREIHTMSLQCKDALIPAPAVAAGHWCGFDLGVHLPLPLPLQPPVLVIETENTKDATEDATEDAAEEAAEPPSRHKQRSRRIRIHIELTLNISVGRRHKKTWSISAPRVDVPQNTYHHRRQKRHSQ